MVAAVLKLKPERCVFLPRRHVDDTTQHVWHLANCVGLQHNCTAGYYCTEQTAKNIDNNCTSRTAPCNSFHFYQLNSSIVAAVKALQGRWVVTDTSTNGTFVNGVKIGKSSSAVLKPGDRLGLSIIAPSSVPTQTPNFINTVE
jgi:hypothetical protein